MASLIQMEETAHAQDLRPNDECWALALSAWKLSPAMRQAWSLGPFLEPPGAVRAAVPAGDDQICPAGSPWSFAAANCSSLGSRQSWKLWPVLLDVPRYIHDLRGCGRVRRDLWGPTGELTRRLVCAFPARRLVYLCLPTASCSPPEVAAGPVVLWMAWIFGARQALENLPSPRLLHANASFERRLPRNLPRDAWIHVRVQGRLGNLLLDLANAMAVAVQTNAQGVVLSRGHHLFSRPGEVLPGLLGELLEVPLPVPESIRRDANVVASLRKLQRTAQGTGAPSQTAGVSAATVWSRSSLGTGEGSFLSSKLTLPLRRRFLQTVLWPLLNRTACPPLPTPAPRLTVHLRGGDTIPALSPDHAQPPCAIYDHIMNSGRFQELEIVAEDDRNPCLAHLRTNYAKMLTRAWVGGSFEEAVCRLLSARNLVFATSSLTGNLALVGHAENVFVPLPTPMISPGTTSFGFAFDAYLGQLCSTFSSVTGFLPNMEYFVNDSVPLHELGTGSGSLHVTQGVPAERTRDYPLENIEIYQC
ncbi:HPSE [Symbiodinium sp. CCMP2592]|nr:HPSE [Symbiodinium sp. CCMP2592]